MKRRDHGPAARDIEALGAFLASPARPEGTLSVHELQGFLFAIASSPELVMPSDWIPLISNDAEMGYADLEEANAVLGRIMAVYNDINARVLEHSDSLPAGCEFRADILANFEEDAPISQWSRGFAIGYDWLSDVWNAYLPAELDEDLSILIVTLSFFGSRRLAEAYVAEILSPSKRSKQTLERIAVAMRKAFPGALAGYAALGRSLTS